MEARLLNRIDAHKYAREAFDLGVRYIGGCCDFEPYHIRALAEELAEERGCRPPGSDMHEGFDALKLSISSDQWKWANPKYWSELKPATGRAGTVNFATPEPPEEK